MTISPFSKRFQDLARSSGKSYRKIAEEMDLSPALLARVINGSRPPSRNLVQSCIEVFGLTASEGSELQYLAAISQEKLSVRPKGPEEAEKILAFFRKLRGPDYLPE